MTSKLNKAGLYGAHAAGIFADKSVDGPDIGTLVVVFDRAKNLPNRKTMGKQDVYVAARLGKEAKKTETDKRGGQTPKWDQELRFTVRDSADYYSLKVSCFSEDKKTDLIGETWIDLKNVVVPGGGQSDQWHSLQCKGKYAGELRMEFTYYDTRPKDEAVMEKRRLGERRENEGGSSNGPSGPRHQKHVKRRPLPADPTNSSQTRSNQQDQTHMSSPLPSSRIHDNLSGPRDAYAHGHTPSSHNQTPPQHNDYPPEPIQQPPINPYDNMASGQIDNRYFQEGHRPYDADPARYDLYEQQPPLGRYHQGPDGFKQPTYDYGESPTPYQTPRREESGYNVEPSLTSHSPNYPPANPYGSPPDYGLPPSPLGSAGQNERQWQPYNRYSTSQKNDVFRDSPLRQSVSHGYENVPSRQPFVEDEDAPPPPPAHRNLNHQSSAAPIYTSGPQASVPPPPLSVAPPSQSNSVPFSAQDRAFNNIMTQEQMLTDSPTSDYSRSSFPSQSSNSVGFHANSREFTDPYDFNENNQNYPPILTPGFDPAVSAAEAERISQNHPQGSRYNSLPPRPPIAQNPPDTSYSPIHRQSPYAVSAFPVNERQSHRSSVSTVQARSTSPNVRATPPRKSVSPHAARPSEEGERRLSGIPFGPDSYDSLNPNAIATASENQTPFYKTPAEAKEAARQHEVEKLRNLGPIIGNDGREIDPSDHLPADTWAPEPERKPSPKKPEVVLRFKNVGNRPQPNPASSRTSPATIPSSRPHSIAATPVYAHSNSQPATPPSFNTNHDPAYVTMGSPASTPSSQPASRGRNRLQKSNPQVPQHPYSSPSVPTLHQSPHPSEYNGPRPHQPLRENENYNPSPPSSQYHDQFQRHPQNSFNSSPMSVNTPGSGSGYRNSMYAAPAGPPIPAKIPINNHSQPDHGGSMDPLSRELSSIDIGSTTVGRGPPGRRINRGGYTYREV